MASSEDSDTVKKRPDIEDIHETLFLERPEWTYLVDERRESEVEIERATKFVERITEAHLGRKESEDVNAKEGEILKGGRRRSAVDSPYSGTNEEWESVSRFARRRPELCLQLLDPESGGMITLYSFFRN